MTVLYGFTTAVAVHLGLFPVVDGQTSQRPDPGTSAACFRPAQAQCTPRRSADAAYTPGVGRRTHQHAQAQRPLKAQAPCTHPRAQRPQQEQAQWTQALALVLRTYLAQARCTQRQVQGQHPLQAQAPCTYPRAQEQRKTLRERCTPRRAQELRSSKTR